MQEFNRAKVLSAPVVISPDLEDLEEETVPEERDSTPSLLGWVDVADLVEALILRARASSTCSLGPRRAAAIGEAVLFVQHRRPYGLGLHEAPQHACRRASRTRKPRQQPAGAAKLTVGFAGAAGADICC